MIDVATAAAMVRAAGGCECDSHVRALQDALNEHIAGEVAQTLDQLAHPPVQVHPAEAPDAAAVAYTATVHGGQDDGKTLSVVDGDRVAVMIVAGYDGTIDVHSKVDRSELRRILRVLLDRTEELCIVDGCEEPRFHSFVAMRDGRIVHLDNYWREVP